MYISLWNISWRFVLSTEQILWHLLNQRFPTPLPPPNSVTLFFPRSYVLVSYTDQLSSSLFAWRHLWWDRWKALLVHWRKYVGDPNPLLITYLKDKVHYEVRYTKKDHEKDPNNVPKSKVPTVLFNGAFMIAPLKQFKLRCTCIKKQCRFWKT